MLNFPIYVIVIIYIAIILIHIAPLIFSIPLILLSINIKKFGFPKINFIGEVIIFPTIMIINMVLIAIFFLKSFGLSSPIYFFGFSLLIFSIFTWFVFIIRKLKNKYQLKISHNMISIIVSLFFLIITIGYNIHYLPNAIKERNTDKLQNALYNGDLKTLSQIFNNRCPNNQKILNYINLLQIFHTPSHIQSANYLLNCMQQNDQNREIFVKHIINLLIESPIKAQSFDKKYDTVINTILNTYYSYLTSANKQFLIQGFSRQIKECSIDCEETISYLLYLLTQKPELNDIFAKNLPTISQNRIQLLLAQGRKEQLQFIYKYKINGSKNIQLALYVLEERNNVLEILFSNTPKILEETIYNSPTEYQPLPVTLLAYSFKYGNISLIDYLINHKLVASDKYNFQYSTNNYNNQYYPKGIKICGNVLLAYITQNQNINHDLRKRVITYLKSDKACDDQNEYTSY